MPKYDFSQFPPCLFITIEYSAKSHVRKRLHMSRIRKDKLYILGIAPNTMMQVSAKHGGTYLWTMDDQEKLVRRWLDKTPLLPEKQEAA